MELEYVAEWFRIADMDLFSAEHLQSLSPQPLEIICYLCEQSSEKFLKGYLVFCGVMDIPKTHNLNVLCERCSDFNERFNDIEKACNALTRYGVQPRYPNEMEIIERDMRKALEYARQIRDFEPLVQLRHEIDETGNIN